MIKKLLCCLTAMSITGTNKIITKYSRIKRYKNFDTSFGFFQENIVNNNSDYKYYISYNATSLQEINSSKSFIHLIYSLIENPENIKKIINAIKNNINTSIVLEYFNSATSNINDGNCYTKACDNNGVSIKKMYKIIKKFIPDFELNESDCEELNLFNIDHEFFDFHNEQIHKLFKKYKLNNNFFEVEKIINDNDDYSPDINDDLIVIKENNKVSINIDYEDDNMIVEYTKSEMLSIKTIYEMLLCLNIIKNKNEFFQLIQCKNKNNNKLHFKNLYNNYFKTPNIEKGDMLTEVTPYKITYGYKKVFDKNYNLINEIKYIKDLDMSELKIDIINKDLHKEQNKEYEKFYNMSQSHYEFLKNLSDVTETFLRNNEKINTI